MKKKKKKKKTFACPRKNFCLSTKKKQKTFACLKKLLLVHDAKGQQKNFFEPAKNTAAFEKSNVQISKI